MRANRRHEQRPALREVGGEPIESRLPRVRPNAPEIGNFGILWLGGASNRTRGPLPKRGGAQWRPERNEERGWRPDKSIWPIPPGQSPLVHGPQFLAKEGETCRTDVVEPRLG